MARNARESEDPAKRLTDEAALSARLRRLGDALDRERTSLSPENDRGQVPPAAAGIAQGFRLATDFVAGVLVGAGIGWGIDRLFGTSPFGLILFLLLGFAAGIVNVVRAAARAPGNSGAGDRPSEAEEPSDLRNHD
jgi:ATP synthase protein I